eukprot:14163680-Heterocapsa_arctica.AAC.1
MLWAAVGRRRLHDTTTSASAKRAGVPLMLLIAPARSTQSSQRGTSPTKRASALRMSCRTPSWL